MKRSVSLLLALVLLAVASIPVFADEQTEREFMQKIWDEAEARFQEDIDPEAERAAVKEAAEAYTNVNLDTMVPLCRVIDITNPNHTFEDYYNHPFSYSFYQSDGNGEYIARIGLRRYDGEFKSSGRDGGIDSGLDVLQQLGFKDAILFLDTGARYVMVKQEDGTAKVYPVPVTGSARSAEALLSEENGIDMQTFLNAAAYRNENLPFDGSMGGMPSVMDCLGKKPASEGNRVFLLGSGILLALFAVGSGLAIFYKRRKHPAGGNS